MMIDIPTMTVDPSTKDTHIVRSVHGKMLTRFTRMCVVMYIVRTCHGVAVKAVAFLSLTRQVRYLHRETIAHMIVITSACLSALQRTVEASLSRMQTTPM